MLKHSDALPQIMFSRVFYRTKLSLFFAVLLDTLPKKRISVQNSLDSFNN